MHSATHRFEACLRRVPPAVLALYHRLEEHSPDTAAHSLRVAEGAMDLAQFSGRFTAAEEEQVFLAGLLHDLGKIAVPKSILDKPCSLSESEWEIVRQHTIWGEQLLMPFLADQPLVLGAVRSEHERWDGRGYPDGLSGAHIPISARIVMVADTIDAVTHDRSYRPGRDLAVAFRVLQDGSGAQFDPEWVALARRLWGSPVRSGRASLGDDAAVVGSETAA